MNRKMKVFVHVLLTGVFLGIGIVAMNRLIAGRTQVKKRQPVSLPPLVRTMPVEVKSRAVVIEAEGTVRPLKQIQLIPQVEGRVVEVCPCLVNGGSFRKGQALLKIDSRDYRLAVILAEAAVKDAESRLAVTREESVSAREEWREFHPDYRKGKKPPPLVVKKPQLEAAQARLEAARADLEKAQLNLQRTQLSAPFNGRVLQENIDAGQYVVRGQPLATLYSTEAAEIVVHLQDQDLAWFYLPGFSPGDGDSAPAEVHAVISGKRRSWSGRVVRMEGKIDERTRMIPVVVRVEKPYATKPPLAVGLFVTVEIKGRTLPHVAVLPRSVLHPNNVVWLLDEGNRLRFRRVDVIRTNGDDVWIRSGLKNGERLITTPLKVVTDGMAVRPFEPAA